jgi:hypothetical protein
VIRENDVVVALCEIVEDDWETVEGEPIPPFTIVPGTRGVVLEAPSRNCLEVEFDGAPTSIWVGPDQIALWKG